MHLSIFVEQFKRLSRKYQKMEIWLRSSALAFHTLLAVVPIVGLLFWYLHHAGVADRWVKTLRNFILEHLNVMSVESFASIFDTLTQSVHHQTWGYIGIVTLIYASWSLITKFGGSLDFILHVKSADETPITLSFLKLTLRRAFIMLGLPIVLLFSLVVTTWIKEESWIKQLLDIEAVGSYLTLPLAWAVDIIAIALVYYFMPRKPVRLRSAIRAAAVVVPCLEVTKFGFGTYNTYAFATHKVYGIFAAIPLTFLWIQFYWAALLFGGLLLKTRRKS